MEPKFVREIITEVQQGKLSIDEAMEKLRFISYENLNDAKVDHHRPLRKGFPETIFCPGKTAEQIVRICKAMLLRNTNILATRCSKEVFDVVKQEIPGAEYFEQARLFRVISKPIQYREGYIAVVSAGTGDMPVAEEGALTCDTYGSHVERIYDVGVAGIHRLFDQLPKIREAVAVIVCAGMEGALPSVVAGLVDKPVIGVPTSIGYGANFKGVSALLGMLNTCASGLAVVNIDNGFGAGTVAVTIHQLISPIGE